MRVHASGFGQVRIQADGIREAFASPAIRLRDRHRRTLVVFREPRDRRKLLDGEAGGIGVRRFREALRLCSRRRATLARRDRRTEARKGVVTVGFAIARPVLST